MTCGRSTASSTDCVLFMLHAQVVAVIVAALVKCQANMAFFGYLFVNMIAWIIMMAVFWLMRLDN